MTTQKRGQKQVRFTEQRARSSGAAARKPWAWLLPVLLLAPLALGAKGCDSAVVGDECPPDFEGADCVEVPDDAACGGLQGLACDATEYCKFAPAALCGAADQTGVCTPKPDICANVFAPVCGCDGDTYGNACEAAAAGISVAADGQCVPGPGPGPTACGGLLGEGCERGEFCDFPLEAQCGAADQTGTCTPVPTACDAILDPVCGCDDKTYSSACAAALASVSVARDGECGTPPVEPDCGGLLGTQCGRGQYCLFPRDAECGAADRTGTCAPIPSACEDIFDPVCGCDGKTYGNACEAAGASVSVAADGECVTPPGGTVCGGLLGGRCATGEYCSFPPEALCGAADQTGICAQMAEVCIQIYAPVCGCDDRTYSSACVASSAGMSVARDGACR